MKVKKLSYVKFVLLTYDNFFSSGKNFVWYSHYL